MQKFLSAFPIVCFLFAFSNSNAQLITGDVVVIRKVNANNILYAQDPDSAVKTAARAYPIQAEYRWEVTKIGSGTYKFYNASKSRYLGIYEASNAANARTTIRQDAGAQDILWRLLPTTKGYKIQNTKSGLFLTEEAAVQMPRRTRRVVQANDNNIENKEWAIDFYSYSPSRADANKIRLEVKLNYIAVAEATRNRIDNGDCRRVFGYVKVEVLEIDANGETKRGFKPENTTGILKYNLFEQLNFTNGPTNGLSFYQDNLTTASNKPPFGSFTFKVDEAAVKNRKVVLVVTTYLGTRHKDNDLASYDALKIE